MAQTIDLVDSTTLGLSRAHFALAAGSGPGEEFGMSRQTRLAILGSLAFAVTAGVFLLPPIPQDPCYHDFADQRSFFSVPNFLDVATNLSFVLVGLLGLRGLFARGAATASFLDWRERWPWAVLFFGALLTGLGSGYYHLDPDDASLVWDRLAMTLVAAGLASAVVAERIGLRLGLGLLAPLVAFGLGSVVWWIHTESQGAGDLRPYAIVQYLPILLIPVMLWLLPPRYTRGGDYLAALGLYLLAKVFETLDGEIFALGGWISGHSLKHFAAAAALHRLHLMLRRREPASCGESPARLQFPEKAP